MNIAQSNGLQQTNFNNFTTNAITTPSSATLNTTPTNGNGTTPNSGGFTSKLNAQQQATNGLFIRKEIQRFESVHPNIYSVYDLIDSITDFNLQQQIREHIVNIEG